jgi:ubiquitin-conjugating enzyme E2 variant
LQPVLTLPGDTLETTKLMMWVTVLSTSLATGVVARAFAINLAGGMLPIWPLLGVAAGWTVGELFSGAFHWATDNYGRLQTPVVGFACAAFQGHHLAPWTISHRSVYNNVYKIGAATIPLILSALWLLPPTGAAFVATMFYSQLLAQEFHRWTHTPPPLLAPWQRQLQQVGIALPLKEHIAHHKPPFDKHYCILTGGLNAVLDSRPVLFWRRLEALVYRANGQEPNSWKDPRVKELALSL